MKALKQFGFVIFVSLPFCIAMEFVPIPGAAKFIAGTLWGIGAMLYALGRFE